jgi:hypothetical protein
MKSALRTIAALAAIFAASPAFASEICKSEDEVRAAFSPSDEGNVTVVALWNSQKLEGVVIWDRSLDDDETSSWELWQSQRAGNSKTFCAKMGEASEILGSAEANISDQRFGLPGDGFPRCSTMGDGLDSIWVRLWANRELGPSRVEVLSAGELSYTLLIASSDFRWVLIENERDRSCYLARGDSINLMGADRALSIDPN